MHIEKKVCDSIIGTLLNIEGKTKGNLNIRLDLQALGIRSQLYSIEKGNKIVLPAACYSLTLAKRKEFCKILQSMKVPNGYSLNISRCVQLNERKIYGLKSHDCHVLVQQLLPLAIRGVLHKNVSGVIIELCNFFKQLYSKVLSTYQLQKLENGIIVILCKLERIFPPSFFDIMVYLLVQMRQRLSDLCNVVGCTLLNGIIMIIYSSFNITSYYIQSINMFIFFNILLIIGTYTL